MSFMYESHGKHTQIIFLSGRKHYRKKQSHDAGGNKIFVCEFVCVSNRLFKQNLIVKHRRFEEINQ